MDMTREEIEKMGFRVLAVTCHLNGVSFDAIPLVGRKRLIRGEVMPTHHMAMAALAERIEYVVGK